jgi:hypothetical protein
MLVIQTYMKPMELIAKYHKRESYFIHRKRKQRIGVSNSYNEIIVKINRE